jgi:hypothetical protein
MGPARLYQRREIQGRLRAVDQQPRGVLASRASASTGSSLSPRSRTSATIRITSSIKWYETARPTSRCNCTDRHLADPRRSDRHHLGRRQPDTTPRTSPTTSCTSTSRKLRQRAQGARRQARATRVTIYLPMIPEAAYAMLACARVGAVHSIVFGGFSPDALAGRIAGCEVHRRHHRRTKVCAAARPGAAQGQRRRGD